MTNRAMKCISCHEEMALAYVNRHLNKDRILLFCPTCARTFHTVSNWGGAKPAGHRVIACIGCDRTVSLVHINLALPRTIVFCFKCAGKLSKEHLWEECRRGGDDGFIGYAPDTIVDGQARGGH